jgi:hypothetical protein
MSYWAIARPLPTQDIRKTEKAHAYISFPNGYEPTVPVMERSKTVRAEIN